MRKSFCFSLLPLGKKASAPVPIVILVIGTFVVCLLILLMLVSNLESLAGSLVGPGVIESISSLERNFHLDSQLDGITQNSDAVVILNLETGAVNLYHKSNLALPKEYLKMYNQGKSFESKVGFKDKFIMLGFIRVGTMELPLVEIKYNKP